MPDGFNHDRFIREMFWKADIGAFVDPVTEERIPLGSAGVAGAPSGLMRLIGAQGTTATGNPASVNRPNWLFKFEVEAPVRAVRLWVYSREYMEASRDWEFAVASTEVAGYANPTDAFVPQATPPAGWPNSGARRQYNAYATTTDATVNGWRRGTWGGSNKSGLLYPGGDLNVQDYGTAGGYSAIPGMICSDVVPLRTVPPASGARPFVLMRLTRTPKLGDTHSWVNVFSGDGEGNGYLYGLMRASIDGQPYGRVIYAQQFDANDSVNNLGTMPGSVLSFASNNNTNMGMPYIALECFYDVPCRSLMALGDSTYESGGWQRYGLMSWIPMAVLSKSTPAEPWTYYNGGASTCHSSVFMPQLEQHIRMGYKPTDVMIPAISTNELPRAGGGTQTAKIADEAIARNEYILALCKKHGIRVLVSNSIYPAGYGPGGPFNVYDTVDKWATAVTRAGHAKLVDLRTGMQPSYLTAADAYYHLTAAGNEYARGVLTAAL